MVLQQEGRKVVILSLDWLLIESEEVAAIRKGVQSVLGVEPENITVCATHTHTAPNTASFSGWGEKERDYIASAIPKIIGAAVEADKALGPVRVGIATTRSETGISRRGVLENNETAFLADPTEPYDSTMTVIRFDGSDGPVGTVVHYGAHGTCIGAAHIVSRDWPGVMADRIEQQTHAPVLFINGTFGDTGPRTSAIYGDAFSAGTGDGLIAATEVGLRAASDALWTWLSIKEFRDDLVLETLTRDITLPYAPLPPLEEAQKQFTACEPNKNKWGADACNYEYWKRVIEAHALPPPTQETYSQTITRLGPLAVVPIPGEPFSAIGRRLRRLSPFAYTLCAGATNGSNGYFVSREARHRGGYEPWVGRAFKAYLYAENIDDVLVKENLKLLRELGKTS